MDIEGRPLNVDEEPKKEIKEIIEIEVTAGDSVRGKIIQKLQNAFPESSVEFSSEATNFCKAKVETKDGQNWEGELSEDDKKWYPRWQARDVSKFPYTLILEMKKVN